MDEIESQDLELSSKLRTFARNVKPVAKRRTQEVINSKSDPIWQEKHQFIFGWYYCLLEGCAQNRSANGLKTSKEYYNHLSRDHPNIKDEESKKGKIRGFPVVIMHNETQGPESNADADITPLLELFKKGTKVLEVKGFSKEHHKLGCLVCLLEGCDFAWYSSNMLQLNKELKNHREIHAKDKKEYFNVRLTYREETDIVIQGPNDGIVSYKSRTTGIRRSKSEGLLSLAELRIGASQSETKDFGSSSRERKNTSLKCISCCSKFRTRLTETCEINREKDDSKCGFCKKEALMDVHKNPLSCPICHQDFDLEKHLRVAHQVHFQCAICKIVCADKKAVKYHVNKNHPPDFRKD